MGPLLSCALESSFKLNDLSSAPAQSDLRNSTPQNQDSSRGAAFRSFAGTKRTGERHADWLRKKERLSTLFIVVFVGHRTIDAHYHLTASASYSALGPFFSGCLENPSVSLANRSFIIRTEGRAGVVLAKT